ncbi:MAG: CDP-alcohol phosphatidyltransferase family protein [Pseudomonadota bacterium]
MTDETAAQTIKHPVRDRAVAWAVHAFTASGIVFGFLAMVSLLQGQEVATFLWLGVALFVDGIDGTLARRFRVKEVVPTFDGAVLDNVIDYFTYVAVPALMIYWFELVPTGWETIAAATILAVSTYTFSNVNVKSDDFYFVGFPALWNVAVLYFYLLDTTPITNLVTIAVLSVLTFVPWKYVHPLRVRALRKTTLTVTCFWSMSILCLLLGAPLYWVWYGIFVLSSIYFALVCIWRSFKHHLPRIPWYKTRA